ncbi:uncharacterized protein LOC134848555 isoform X2 [Symsagittifera roscoffensis]|uniref:uncharacterized protein LOC134848555 isoform X2 n=1 Tax=Symsagittifera roscoffensis TaxID=84072 RepID=UPI00307BA4A1
MSFIGNIAALAATNPHLHLAPPPPPNSTGGTLARDPTWLQVEVCREFLRQSCKRDNTECKYAHPSSNVDIQNGKVTVCFDAFKDRCTRTSCKYFHAPAQMKADLEMRGKMSLMRQKSEQMALQNHNSAAAAAQLALLQLHQQQHNQSLLNPFLHNQPALLQATNPAVTLAQYQQLLQQHGYASPHTHPQPGSAAATALVPSSCTAATSVSAVSSSPSNVNNNNTHLVDPNSMGGLVMTSAGGVINGVNLSSPAHMCSSDSPPLNGKAFTVEVCREFSRGACSRSDEECRYAHPEPQVAVDPTDNRVTICIDWLKSAGQMCSREQQPHANNNNSPTSEKCKYFHPPAHIMERFQNGTNAGVAGGGGGGLLQHQQINQLAAPQNSGHSPLFTFQSPLNIQQLCKSSNNNQTSLPPNIQGMNNLHLGSSQRGLALAGGCLPVAPGNPFHTPGASNASHFNAQYLQQLCNNNNNNGNNYVPSVSQKRKAFEDYSANRAVVQPSPAMFNPQVRNSAMLQNNNNNHSGFNLPTNPAALANCVPAGGNGNVFPTYGKMLRLDSNGMNGATKLTSPAANQAAVNVSQMSQAAAAAALGVGAYSPYGNSQASPQAFFYNPLYQAQLLAASNQTQPSLIPVTSPAFLANPGAGMINGAHSPALYASPIHNGRFAAFG